MILASFSEVLSLGAILPFLTVLSSPEWIFNNIYLKPFINLLEIKESKDLVFPLTMVFIFAILFSAFMRLILLWYQNKISFSIGGEISNKLYKNILYQPYEAHLKQNSSEVIALIGKVNSIVWVILMPILTIISSSFILLMILTTLFFINVKIAIISILSFTFFYSIVIKISKQKLSDASKIINLESGKVIKSLQEGLGGIRDLIIDKSYDTYSNIYFKADASSRKAHINLALISASPRYGIEAFGMILISILAFNMSKNSNGITSVIPILGSLALGAQRMMPVLQQMYNSWATLKGGQSVLENVLETLNLDTQSNGLLHKESKPISFKNSFKLQNISFKYDINLPNVLDNINIEIKKGSKTGIIGETGSGKSTFMDIIMGLIKPTIGNLVIDDLLLDDFNKNSWQKKIAHVPQTIYLTDQSIAENIAFGIPYDLIDFNKVELAAEMAQISKTIEQLEYKYDTLVGERGVRLSGGQKQRIGIARALYKSAEIIIFDEATSAIDTETEKDVMNAIDNLDKEITIILIAHRISTLKNCDQIIKFNKNKNIEILNFSDLLSIN